MESWNRIDKIISVKKTSSEPGTVWTVYSEQCSNLQWMISCSRKYARKGEANSVQMLFVMPTISSHTLGQEGDTWSAAIDVSFSIYILKTIWRTSAFLLRLQVFPFLPSGDIGSGLENQGGSPHLHAFSPVHNEFLRFTYHVAPANLFASIAGDPLCWLTFSSIGVSWTHSTLWLDIISNACVTKLNISARSWKSIVHSDVEIWNVMYLVMC